MTRVSERDAGVLEHLRRAFHGVHVGLRAHDDPDARRVDARSSSSWASVSGSVVVAGWGCSVMAHALHGPLGDVAPQLPPVELDQVGGSIGTSRAAAGSGPSAVTFRTRPPAVTIVAVGAARGARVDDLGAARRPPSEAGDDVAAGGRRRVAGRWPARRVTAQSSPNSIVEPSRPPGRVARDSSVAAGRCAGAAGRPASRDRRSAR